jgi:hypothetical protein
MAGIQLYQNGRGRFFRCHNHTLDRVVINAVDAEYGRIRLLRAPDNINTLFKCHLFSPFSISVILTDTFACRLIPFLSMFMRKSSGS